MPTRELEVVEVKMETPTTKAIRVAVGSPPIPFKPGQYCLVKIAVGKGQEDRALSIASSPMVTDSLIFASRISDSPYKKAFLALKPNDRVTLTGPMGQFVYDESAPYTVFLSGGIGITPLKSMMEYIADRGLNHQAILFFGNRTPSEIPFQRDLERLSRTCSNLKIFHVVSNPEGAGEGWKGHTGRINEGLIRQHVVILNEARYYICGPPGMVSGLRGLLDQMGIPGEQITIENFNGYD